jgi:hypothetical protein
VKIDKKQLLKMIDELQRSPDDRVRILGEAGFGMVGVGLGAAAAGAVAGIAGVTSIPVLTTAAGWLGVTAVAATPVGWVIGVAAAGGALAYGGLRLVRNGAMAEGRKQELLVAYRERLVEMEAKERSDALRLEDKSEFISSLRELIEKNILVVGKAFHLIGEVEAGRIPLSQACQLVISLLESAGGSGH